ncbi:hypothetical protein U9M48_021341 [Paspalum notatum var. saurae]|uniref:2-carboxy-D-arabinitol-1-phosphatase n=1 Tax=Paspalum notatum var. saurae TaxID=547442 RepID=A0AAQ3TH65_PASNO
MPRSRVEKLVVPIVLSAGRPGNGLGFTGHTAFSAAVAHSRTRAACSPSRHSSCRFLPVVAAKRRPTFSIRATQSGVSVQKSLPPDNDTPVTGAAYSFTGATTSLTSKILTSSKKITLVRHGLSSWNAESRVQGSSNLSVLTETGAKQAEKCRDALANIKFDVCFSSPISRAKSTAEIIWRGKEEPLVFLDSLKEAHLFFLEGMTNADAKKQYPELYTKWREDPSNFHVNGIYPIRELWGTARQAWEQILLTPVRFRAIDVNNGGMCVFTVNKQGEAMLQALNMTAHMYSDYTYQY